MGQPAVFLDRDGVINEDRNYVYQIDDFKFIDGVIEACQKLKQKGYLLVVVTNQSGIGRGMFTEQQFMQLTEWMDWSMADRGVDLDGIYFCPHGPDDGCQCRKPEPGMLLEAAKELNIDLSRSLMVGDKPADLQAGRAAGVSQVVLVRSGKAVTAEGEQQADLVIDALPDLLAHL